ncbi:F0F1 ATP synthase subunit B [Jannaschia seohaensis]|uniref:ATP synthase subunit b n=1 Tax=Jannaschia seohaensis TaxID=475081 RepID=A0A2Y9ATC9_9RHOB|nr:F0F1 ATP synthase subunit B [Jannaschia seohaensis]PWJ19106.1 F-type H+-transporting ATPase subunit b [Jannaschia seohaensis]SSA45737.1 F-type H+-transporting ATPase subunit b [Jannaschia seohaensis]
MIRTTIPLILLASPALAASGEYGFFSLRNTDFVVSIGFVIFIGILVYFKVPGLLLGMLDSRAEGIQKDLDEARSLRDEATALLADYERKTREARAQADEIVATAKAEAEASNVQARKDLEASVERRLAAAADQIESARAAAVREVRDEAIRVATAVAADMLAKQTSASDRDAMIDRSIEAVRERLH